MTDTLDHDTKETRKPAREESLWVTDAEMIRRMGVPEKIARAAIHALDRDRGSSFPQKKALWGNRRYWPAVKAYLDRTNGLKVDASPRRSSHD